uniref:Phosphoinositide phospholipase C n=1 Tax=Parascaris equorum TaxID=6256 RepID=A0A914S2M9_PAREQ
MKEISVAIDSIREIRVGRNTELFRATENCITDVQDECAFSIIHGDDYESLDLIAQTPDDANIWVTGLMALSSGHKADCQPSGSQSLATLRERWLESVFDEADISGSGYISDKCAVRLIRQISGRLHLNRVKHRVKMVGVTRGFTNYLLCDECCLFDVTHRCVCHEMNHPFAHYFIAASYNTYLVEDQLKGPSSSDGYLSALKRSCRFIEIDVWEPCEADGESEPMIFHGSKPTSKLALSAALNTINEVAFERTRYPLFIRLELHLSVKWQLVLVDMLTSTLAGRLYRPDEDPVDWIDGELSCIPKGKRLKAMDEKSGEVSEEDESVEVAENKVTTEQRKTDRRIVLCKQLSDLMCPWAMSVALKKLASASCGEFSSRRHVLSLSESDCLRMLHTYASEFTQVTKDFVTRVTPNSIRVSEPSSLKRLAGLRHRLDETEPKSSLRDDFLIF